MSVKWVTVFFTYDEAEAQIVKGLLEGQGIEVVVDSLRISPYPVSVGMIGEIRLLVRDGDLERAKEVLKIMEDKA